MHDRWTPVGMTGEDKSSIGHPKARGPQIRRLVTDSLQFLHRGVTNRRWQLWDTLPSKGRRLPSRQSVQPRDFRRSASEQECASLFVRATAARPTRVHDLDRD